MTGARLRLAVVVVATLSVASFVIQATLMRPHLWPAGAGVVLSGDDVMASLAEPPTLGLAHLPDLASVVGRPIVVVAVHPGSVADRAGLAPGAVVTAVEDREGRRTTIGPTLAADAREALAVWRQMYRLSPRGAVTLHVADMPDAASRPVVLERPAVWSLDGATLTTWLRGYHVGPLAKHFVYTLAALLVVALGARGITARLMTLAFLLMGAADAGPLLGAELGIPVLGPVLLAFSWLEAALAFPIIGLAVLHFPSRSPLLDRHRWIVPVLWLVTIPLGGIGALATLYLLGVDSVGGPVAWVASRPWVFNLCFGLGLANNVACVTEGVHRYRINPDAAERRRIETLVITAVPGMLAYALQTGAPILGELLGTPFRWPWPVSLGLYALILLSALGFAYAVAVRRALSPRTVLRQGMQYALARRTLGLLTALPAILLVASILRQSDRPLSSIVRGQPLFYISSVVLFALGLRYRDYAQRWLDRRFFRTEYDAREILLSLASRVPRETDPRALVTLVLNDIASALHPDSAAVLADSGAEFEPIHAIGPAPAPVRAGSGLLQLLQWSDAPLDVTLDDEGSPAGRLPASDRAWLRESHAALLVPILAGSGAARPLVGFIALGPKRSEEPFTSEDRRLLASIVGQMGLALDLSRLRRQMAMATPVEALASAPTMAPVTPFARGIEVGVVIEGKYRVDAVIGRGGMGAVYRARDVRLDRDVAVKVVRGELVSAPEARERFRREAQMAARLHHPSIVTVFDYGTLPDGAAYLVMEYVRGQDLRSRLAQGTLAPRACAELVTGIAAGLEAAHREGILHRDIKPENILLSEQEGGPKVLDFGVARMTGLADAGRTLTAGGTIVGTPAYMAPEQLRGEPVDARADVYSLAVVACEMLTGRLPFSAGSLVDVAMRQASSLPDIAEDATPAAARDVLRRALSVDREQRPASAVVFATAFARALEPGSGARS